MAKPYLDVHVADHCNLRCAGCVHFSPLAEPRFLDLGQYDQDLSALASIAGIEEYIHELSLMGGEPLLHPELPEVLRLSRALLPKMGIALVSNGLLLKRMGEEFWRAMRECDVKLQLSPYPLRVDYPALLELATSHGVEAALTRDVTRTREGKEVFFRLSLDESGSQDPVASHNRCPFGGRTLQMSEGRIWPCQVAAHHGTLNKRFGLDMRSQKEDSLAIADIDSTDQIEELRRHPHPMCRYCDMEHLSVAEWRTSSFEAAEWLKEKPEGEQIRQTSASRI
jgi:ABC-2 type transport system ATP-binding protein